MGKDFKSFSVLAPCDKISTQSNLRKEDFTLAHSLRITACCCKDTVAEAWGSDSHHSIAPRVKKHKADRKWGKVTITKNLSSVTHFLQQGSTFYRFQDLPKPCYLLRTMCSKPVEGISHSTHNIWVNIKKCILDQMLREHLIPLHSLRQILFGHGLVPSVSMYAHMCIEFLLVSAYCAFAFVETDSHHGLLHSTYAIVHCWRAWNL